MVGNIIEIMPGIKIVDYSEKGDDDNFERIGASRENTDLKSDTSHRRVPLIQDAYDFY